jgi:S-DNA-T family DNA segregation ATPase FtsK/SpoIIIE
VGGGVSSVFKKLAKQPKKSEAPVEIIEETPPTEIEEVEVVPTINGSENFKEPKPIVEKVETPSVPDLVFGDEKIPITPIRETGELDEEILEDAEAKAETQKEPEPPSKPQNFDNYTLPPTEFLVPAQPRIEQKDEELLSIAQELTGKTKEFNVTGRVVHICQGPVVTTYEFKPDPGVKYSRVTGLADDLCLALKAESIRIERIPGKAFVGIEVPNHQRETIQLREVIESKKFRDSNSLLTIALGKTIDGLNYVADLAKMPHLLIAGATGAGKSVGVNTLVVSILYKAKPDEVKFIMVDPKRLELGVYEDIPHLATPIIKDPKGAAIALKWAVSEMEKRYKDLAGWGVRNIDGFNSEVKRRNADGYFDENGEPWRPLPYIVIIIDELADLMMVSGKEVEESITRLAQMARAVGIHLVLATQRPSVDVITGLIKANFPSRISFRVSSKVDSRTIIDSNGAESLLGKGDMLFLPPATSQLVRVHGAFVDEKEIYKIVEHIKAQGRPEYDTTITKTEDELDDSGELPGRKDELFWDALRTVVMAKKASTSLLQRHLRIGYGRAAAILDAMVKEGYIGDMDGSTRARPILQKAYDDLQDIEEQESV